MGRLKECKYVRTIYEKNNFFIGVFKTKDENVPKTARGRNSTQNCFEFTAVGYNLPTTNAVSIDFEGEWEKSQYGQQFKVESYTEKAPQTKDGVIAYLSSGIIKGIGPKTAKVIVDKFGQDTLEIIEKEPNRLLEIRGISEAKLEKIVKAISENQELKEIITYLAPFGVSNKKIAKIYKTFGNESMQIISKSPFKLCEISGFGFRTVDEIARKANCNMNDRLRIKAGIICALDDAEANGHLFLPEPELNDAVYKILNDKLDEESVTVQMIETEMNKGCKDGWLVMDNDNVYKKMLYIYEKETAQKIARILTNSIWFNANIDKEIETTQKKFNTILSKSQVEAIKMCFSNPLSIITGGPGTGKTTVLKSILDIYSRVAKHKEVLLAAPTGLAARRMSDATGNVACTLHSALGLYHKEDDEEDKNEDAIEDEKLNADFIVIDETSMLDMKLVNILMDRVKDNAHILFVGDVDQLPSVGAGNVLREMINCDIIATTHLDTVFRQAEMSRIAVNAHSINNGEVRLNYGNDFAFIDTNSENIAEEVKKIYVSEIAEDGVENVQVLSPFKKRGNSGTINLNEILRETVNPKKSNNQLVSGSKSFRIGDKVMQIKNSENVCNGDIGFVKAITENEYGEKELEVEFSGNRLEIYTVDDLEKLELASAITIHKSQGSEFKTVIIPILKEQYIMLRRNLIYTAVTRAKKKIVLVGERNALFMAIGKNDIGKRNTKLKERILNSYAKCSQKKKIV